MAWHAAVHDVAKSWIGLGDGTTTTECSERNAITWTKEFIMCIPLIYPQIQSSGHPKGYSSPRHLGEQQLLCRVLWQLSFVDWDEGADATEVGFLIS